MKIIKRNFDKKLNYIEYSKREKYIISQMNKKIAKYLEQYFATILHKENVSISDIIDFYNKDNLPAYDQYGNILKQRGDISKKQMKPKKEL